MLRSFRVANHKSIREEQELLLVPAYDKTRPVVPVTAIFGANASGKSNLLDALHWMQDAVVNSFSAWKPGFGVPRQPFALDPDAVRLPSGYSVEIVVDGLRYSYGVEVDDDGVRQEWLYAYPRSRRRIIFEREDGAIRLGSTVPDHRSRGEALGRQTRSNALFLTVAALNDLAEVQPVYQWFASSLSFAAVDGTDAAAALIKRLRTQAQIPIVELIKAADLGITDITVRTEKIRLTAGLLNRLVERGLLKAEPGRQFGAGERLDDSLVSVNDIWEAVRELATTETLDSPASLAFHHGSQGALLTLEQQSAGTKSWINLVSSALDCVERGGLLVVDEFDASLHPHLTARLVNVFRDAETNPHDAQLLFTTHDATLLDDDTLARDEIWFVEKGADTGTTRLFPLTDFHPRKNENTAGRYLAGSYGAIPVLSDFEFREAVRRGRESVDAA